MHMTCMNIMHFLFNQILDEDGFIGDVRTQSGDIQDTIDEYDTPRLVKPRNL